MKKHQTYRYELDPNDRQRTLFAKAAGTARFAFNWGLRRRIEQFEKNEGKAKFTDEMKQHKELNAIKKAEFPWMYEVSKCVPQEGLRDLDRAFQNFWRGRKAGRKVGFPKFKRKGEHDSFRFSAAVHVTTVGVFLPRIGPVRTKESTAKFSGHILSATVSREADRWFVSVCVEAACANAQPGSGPCVGVDLGIKTFAVVSDGSEVEAPKPLAAKLKLLRRRSRQHSRKQKGSNNRKKAALRLARLHRKIRNVRCDFLHKLTTQLAKTKRVVVVEDLAVGVMVRNRSLARAITDASWYGFRRMLEYKCQWYGSELIVAPRWFPSTRRCSKCGHVGPKLELSKRTFNCLACSFTGDRDLNASLNLKWYGEFHRNQAHAKTPAEIPPPMACKSMRKPGRGSAKQEVNTMQPSG